MLLCRCRTSLRWRRGGAQAGKLSSIREPRIRGNDLSEHQFFGVWIRATSVAGTPSIRVSLKQAPAPEGAAADFVEPNVSAEIVSNLNDEVPHVYPIAPTPMPAVRFVLTGLGANPGDTRVTMFLFMQRG